MKRKAMKQPQQEPQMSLGKEFGFHILGEVALYALYGAVRLLVRGIGALV